MGLAACLRSLCHMPLTTCVFDMDGLLLESESLWRQAETEMSAELGLGFTKADFERTMGVRMRDVAELWFQWKPWTGPTPAEVADEVISRVVELVVDAEPLPGVVETLEAVADRGMRVALCSSSDDLLIRASMEALGFGDRFEVLHSAEHDEFGKPHPAPYLATAAELGVDPSSCVAFEDSVTGCLSAKSAGMAVIAVPDSASRGTSRFGFADVVLESLEQFNVDMLDEIDATTPVPSMSRPRFHLAFGVDDLSAARHFYGDVLGCVEGRSADTWVDFNLWGHQIVAHLDPSIRSRGAVTTNDVDGHDVPANHFGVLLHRSAWHDLVARLQASDTTFLMEPTVRFEGLAGEQHTCFVLDPAGNALEFKAFADDRAVFEK